MRRRIHRVQRTALVLTGTGTAGAYHAGVLRALHEAGVKIDIVAGRGMGAVGALFTAVDAAARLWEPNGLWLGKPQVSGLYEWRPIWRAAGYSLAFAIVALFLPIVVLLLSAVFYPILLLIDLIAPNTGAALTLRLSQTMGEWFSGGLVSALVSRLVTAGVLLLVGTLAVGWVRERTRRPRRRTQGEPWWQALGAPLSTARAAQWATGGFWEFIHGATPLPPAAAELSRRYGELLTENLGQPGYRELILAAHDLETRRDLVFALIASEGRTRFFGVHSGAVGRGRRGAGRSLGTGRDHVMDAITAALAVPILTEPHLVTFGTDTFWRGETHRTRDRPAALVRLLEEVLGGRRRAGDHRQRRYAARSGACAGGASRRSARAARRLSGGRRDRRDARRRHGAVRSLLRASSRFSRSTTRSDSFAFGGAHDERSDQRAAAEGADRSRLRGCLPSVHRAGGGSKRRAAGARHAAADAARPP